MAEVFEGNYNSHFSEKVWSSIKSYSDFIKHLVKKHCPNGSYVCDDGDCRRGYFKYQNKMYTIRTWNINETKKGARVEYTICKNDMSIEETEKRFQSNLCFESASS